MFQFINHIYTFDAGVTRFQITRLIRITRARGMPNKAEMNEALVPVPLTQV